MPPLWDTPAAVHPRALEAAEHQGWDRSYLDLERDQVPKRLRDEMFEYLLDGNTMGGHSAAFVLALFFDDVQWARRILATFRPRFPHAYFDKVRSKPMVMVMKDAGFPITAYESLERALTWGNVNGAEWLLELGADVHAQSGQRSYVRAVTEHHWQPDSLRWLLDHGVRMEAAHFTKDTHRDAVAFLARAGWTFRGTASLQRLCARRVRELQMDYSGLPPVLVEDVREYRV